MSQGWMEVKLQVFSSNVSDDLWDLTPTS